MRTWQGGHVPYSMATREGSHDLVLLFALSAGATRRLNDEELRRRYNVNCFAQSECCSWTVYKLKNGTLCSDLKRPQACRVAQIAS
jgi:hypothetical protein